MCGQSTAVGAEATAVPALRGVAQRRPGRLVHDGLERRRPQLCLVEVYHEVATDKSPEIGPQLPHARRIRVELFEDLLVSDSGLSNFLHLVIV